MMLSISEILSMKKKYYRLLSEKDYNTIIKTDEKSQYKYDSLKGWIKTGLFMHYWWEESDTYDMYEEISPQEAAEKYGVKYEDVMDIQGI